MRTCRKMSFFDFSLFSRFRSQMSEYILGVLRSHYGDFFPFKGLSKKIMMISFHLKGFWRNKKKIKNEVFDDRGLKEKYRFWTFHSFADFTAKWENYYISGVLRSYYDDFLPIKGVLKKIKKNWSFRWPWTCKKNVVFGLFTLLLILQPNEWIITFEVSWGHIMMISCHLEGFWKNEKKNEVSENYYISGVLRSYYDDFLPIKGVFEKKKKNEVFDHRGPAEKCRFWTFHSFTDFAA